MTRMTEHIQRSPLKSAEVPNKASPVVGAPLVKQGFSVGVAAGVVDRDVEVVVAASTARVTGDLGLLPARSDALTTASGIRAGFLISRWMRSPGPPRS
jgi:hypothetical protein